MAESRTTGSIRRWVALIASGAIAISLIVVPLVARAANGTQIASFDAGVTAGIPGCSVGVGTGIAYDGRSLILSCWNSNVLERVDAVAHTNNGALAISGISDIKAIAYDAGRDRLWACNGFSTVALIDMNTKTIDPTFRPFSNAGCTDGLAYDGADDTLWSSADAASTIQHYRLDGTLISSTPVSSLLGGCGNSGIASGGDSLYLANNGCSQIYQVNKAITSSSLLSTFPRRIEDLECDGNTFPGEGAIWSVDAYDRILNAWEIPPHTCEFGGGFANNASAEAYTADLRVDAVPLTTGKLSRSYAEKGKTDAHSIAAQSVPGAVDLSVGQTTATAAEKDNVDTSKAIGGKTWTTLNPAPAYNFSNSYCGGLNPTKSYSGTLSNGGGPYAATSIDLTSFAGKTVRVRFHLASDGSVTYPGWYIDDVNIGVE